MVWDIWILSLTHKKEIEWNIVLFPKKRFIVIKIYWVTYHYFRLWYIVGICVNFYSLNKYVGRFD